MLRCLRWLLLLLLLLRGSRSLLLKYRPPTCRTTLLSLQPRPQTVKVEDMAADELLWRLVESTSLRSWGRRLGLDHPVNVVPGIGRWTSSSHLLSTDDTRAVCAGEILMGGVGEPGIHVARGCSVA